jgi:methionyl-tRNA formyltransferase
MKKIIFVGTTEFGIPTLEKLKTLFEIPLIITQPDRPTGRKQTLTPPPIKLWAQKNNIQVSQPEKISDVKSNIKELTPDILLVAAYGQIIPAEILNIAKMGSVNIHGSVLPKYRGPTPIQTAILNNDKDTGITLLKMDEKIDHGPIITAVHIPIRENENFITLYSRLAELSADLCIKSLPDYIDGKLIPREQNHSAATFTKLIAKDDGRIKWTNSAQMIHQQVLALNPEPGTWTRLEEKSVKILKTELLIENKIELAGKLYRSGENLAVKCADFSLKLIEVQPEGKKPMPGSDFLNGLKNLETKIFV